MFIVCKYAHSLTNFLGGSIPQAKYLNKIKSKDDEIATLKSQKSKLAYKLRKTRANLSVAKSAVRNGDSATRVAVSAAIRKTTQSERSRHSFEKANINKKINKSSKNEKVSKRFPILMCTIISYS